MTIGNGLPSIISPPGPISSRIASNAISIGAAISISLRMLMIWMSCSTIPVDMLISPCRVCPVPADRSLALRSARSLIRSSW